MASASSCYEESVKRCDTITGASIRTRDSLWKAEQWIATYCKPKPVQCQYKVSKDKEKFLRGFESEIILFEAAAREIRKVGLIKLPSAEKLKAELDGFSTRETALQTELRKTQREKEA